MRSLSYNKQVKFVGHMIITEGVEAHQSKVEAILNMPAPTDAHRVQRWFIQIPPKSCQWFTADTRANQKTCGLELVGRMWGSIYYSEEEDYRGSFARLF